jgi:1-aminocyclopropane-1-carboxylate deaminase/D-cysteine desulfhydrase-like pyridoxal-dependent ACC family enzyme
MGLALGVDTLVTAGAAQSNHFRQTAAAATKAGLRREYEFEWQKPYAKELA